MNYYDNSMLGSYKDCPRKYYLRHVRNWRGQGIAMPLVFGLCWHEAMDVVWTQAKNLPPEDLLEAAFLQFSRMWAEQGAIPYQEMTIETLEMLSPRTPLIAKEMLKSYIQHHARILREAELLAPEQPFAVPLPGLEQRWYIGRIDKVITYNGQTLAIEHKTTTEYKKDGGFKTTYIEGWFSDSQVKGYEFGGGLFFPNLRQVWVDAALVHKSVRAFRFIPVAHQFPLLEEWIRDTRTWITRLEADLAAGYFAKNEGSCMGKYGPCSFLDICRTIHDPAALSTPPEGYVEEKWEPFDLLHIEKVLNKETT